MCARRPTRCEKQKTTENAIAKIQKGSSAIAYFWFVQSVYRWTDASIYRLFLNGDRWFRYSAGRVEWQKQPIMQTILRKVCLATLVYVLRGHRRAKRCVGGEIIEVVKEKLCDESGRTTTNVCALSSADIICVLGWLEFISRSLSPIACICLELSTSW